MTTYINVGAKTPDGERIPSKAALKRLLVGGKVKGQPVEPQPSEVLFDKTAALGPGDEVYRGDALPADATLQVCGPDPYEKRDWWASVKFVNGKIVVS